MSLLFLKSVAVNSQAQSGYYHWLLPRSPNSRYRFGIPPRFPLYFLNASAYNHALESICSAKRTTLLFSTFSIYVGVVLKYYKKKSFFPGLSPHLCTPSNGHIQGPMSCSSLPFCFINLKMVALWAIPHQREILLHCAVVIVKGFKLPSTFLNALEC